MFDSKKNNNNNNFINYGDSNKSNLTSISENKNKQYDTDKLKNILNDLDHLYKNIKETKIEENIQKSIFIDGLKDNNLNSLISSNQNIENNNSNYANKSNNNGNDILVEQNTQSRNEVSNINIYNIQNNINNIEKIDLEKIANSFLFQELSKGNLHWLISTKDIKMEKQIGYGGSSEVYKANYRGTDVAVKKLRILDVKEENLKEFKREVSSLIMLRHPNLVLFMGAM